MAKGDLSATMAATLAEALESGGKLVRHQGGYWTKPGAVMSATIGQPFDWWASTPTVNALVSRGRMKFTEHREGRGGRFPIAAEVMPEMTA